MVYLIIFLLTAAPAPGSGVTVVPFDSWEACEAAAELVSKVEIPPLEKFSPKADRVLPDVIAICADRDTAQAKEWN